MGLFFPTSNRGIKFHSVFRRLVWFSIAGAYSSQDEESRKWGHIPLPVSVFPLENEENYLEILAGHICFWHANHVLLTAGVTEKASKKNGILIHSSVATDLLNRHFLGRDLDDMAAKPTLQGGWHELVKECVYSTSHEALHMELWGSTVWGQSLPSNPMALDIINVIGRREQYRRRNLPQAF